MTVSQRELAPDIWLVETQGRLDQTLTPQLEAALKALLANGHNNIIVDLSHATYINSSGLRSLITGRRLSQSGGGDIAICGLTERLAEVFEMVGLDQVLTIYNSCDEARDHFAL
ncbi:MAG: STAS domain-containing protein [Candidatus Promineifilaceae bacterium]|jgi:anti-sigma B factor antagonist